MIESITGYDPHVPGPTPSMQTIPTPLKFIHQPTHAFEALARTDPDPLAVFFRQIVWLALLPPVFAFIGASIFGWRLGAAQPLYLPGDALTLISIGYFLVLLFGLVSTAFVGRWMAPTYGADARLGTHLALVGIVAAPMVAGSALHLFPHVFINLLVFIPALIWSMYLLYKGLPIVLGTGPERGMLMASALIAYLLVGAVTVLGLTVALWASGIGPSIGV